MRVLEELFAAALWVVLLPFAVARRLGDSGRLGDAASTSGAWRQESRSLAAPLPANEPSLAFSRAASLWLRARRAISPP